MEVFELDTKKITYLLLTIPYGVVHCVARLFVVGDEYFFHIRAAVEGEGVSVVLEVFGESELRCVVGGSYFARRRIRSSGSGGGGIAVI